MKLAGISGRWWASALCLVAAAAGDTWMFQAWHRDATPAPTSNFTDAIALLLR